jgi:hypothetical protein
MGTPKGVPTLFGLLQWALVGDGGPGQDIAAAVRNIHQTEFLLVGGYLDVEVPCAARPATESCAAETLGIQRGNFEGLGAAALAASTGGSKGACTRAARIQTYGAEHYGRLTASGVSDDGHLPWPGQLGDSDWLSACLSLPKTPAGPSNLDRPSDAMPTLVS